MTDWFIVEIYFVIFPQDCLPNLAGALLRNLCMISKKDWQSGVGVTAQTTTNATISQSHCSNKYQNDSLVKFVGCSFGNVSVTCDKTSPNKRPLQSSDHIFIRQRLHTSEVLLQNQDHPRI